MRLYALLAAAAAAVSPLVFAACSANPGSPLPEAPADEGGTDPSNEDAGTTNPPPDSGGGARDSGGNNKDGGSTVPPGTLLKQGDVSIQGVTSDGYVVYTLTAGNATSLEIVNVSTKQSTVLAQTFGQNDGVVVDGKVVAFWTGVQNSVGSLSLWSAANGVKSVGPNSISGFFAASPDGTRVAYSTNVSQQRLTSIAVGNPALSPASTIAFTNVGQGTQQAPCPPSMGFTGTRLFVSVCFNTGTAPSIRTTSDTGVNTTILTNSDGTWATSAAGDRAFVIAATNKAAQSHTVPGNQSTNIEQNVAEGVLTANGATAIYRTTGNVLKMASTTAPVNATVLTQNVRGLLGLSPDDKYVLAFSNAPDTANQNFPRIDLQLASATAAGALTPLLAQSTGLPVGFTSTSSHAVYITDLPASGPPVGNLKAKPVGGGAEVMIAQGAVLPRLVKGSAKVAFADNLQQVGQNGVAVDLEVADLAAGGAPKLVIDAVDVSYDLDDKNLYYTITGQGLFYKAIP